MVREEQTVAVELTDAELEAVVGGMGLCGKGKKEEKTDSCSTCG